MWENGCEKAKYTKRWWFNKPYAEGGSQDGCMLSKWKITWQFWYALCNTSCVTHVLLFSCMVNIKHCNTQIILCAINSTSFKVKLLCTACASPSPHHAGVPYSRGRRRSATGCSHQLFNKQASKFSKPLCASVFTVSYYTHTHVQS